MDAVVGIPFWGAQTSYLNFCEEDYVVTRYVAEFVNTLSSLAFIAYGIYGLCNNCQTRGGSSRLASYCGLIGVGVCSGGYHMTLKYHTQMSDELSMHLLTTPLLYRVLTFQTSAQYTKLIGVVLSTLFATVMITHMVMDEFILHATTFGLGVYLIIARISKIIPRQVPDPLLRRRLRTITALGCSAFFCGYFLWLIDEWACRLLINMRHSVGLPAAFFLELHGWWHILTAMGGYIAVVVVDLITVGEVHEDPTDSFAWPVPSIANFVSGIARTAKHE